MSTQHAPPVDPYRVLELHPAAPRELIVEAYWRLIARHKGRAISTAADDAIVEINAAYALLIDDAARAAYDQEHGLTQLKRPHVRISRKRRDVLGLGGTAITVASHSDYYHLLWVDRDADTEIIDVAHDVLSRKAIGHSAEDGFLRDLQEEAYLTLRNPPRRAQYDASFKSEGLQAGPASLVPTRGQLSGHAEQPEAMSTSTDTEPAFEQEADQRRPGTMQIRTAQAEQIRMAGSEEIRMARHDVAKEVATVPIRRSPT